MKLPRPYPRAYVEMVAVVLVTLAIIQYMGLFSDTAGEIDVGFLAGVGVLIPIFTYLLSVLTESVSWLPRWARMTQSEP